jgi:tetratricopeptide (TPR) repeat protein
MQPRLADALAAFQQGQLDRARELAEDELQADPSSPQLQHLMGLIECRLGRLESGVEWLRRAVHVDPDNVAYRVMLARALIDSGRPEQAFEIAHPPSGTSPAEFALWHARAEAADAVGAPLEAAEAWSNLSAVRPDDWLVWSNLGKSLGEMGHWPEAARVLERAVALNPAELPLRRNLAGALNNAGRADESVEEFRRCIGAAPGDKSLRISLAAILAELGRGQESRAELDQAAKLAGVAIGEDGDGLVRIVADGTGCVDLVGLKEIADLLERTSRMDALARLIEDAERLGIAPKQIGYPAAAAALRQGNPEDARRLLLAESPDAVPSRWHWLMARIEDAMGNSAAAFAEAEAMNRSAHDYGGWRERGAEQRVAVRRLAETITPAWAAQLRTLDQDDRGSPAFVVGFPRSGTTLLDTFLRGHPATEVVEELPLIRVAEDVLGDMAELPRRSTAEVERAREAYFAELGRHGAPATSGLLIDKLPLNMLAAPVIHSLFPEACLIFAQRHPCDVVLSCFMQAFVLNYSMASFLDIADAADFYDAAMTVWTRSCEALPIKVHTIAYEELVVEPEATLRPAIDFLGLDWQPQLLDHRATAKARGRINTPSYNQVTQPLSRAPSGRWRRYEKQLAPVLPVLLPWAKRFGYRD